MKEIIKKLNEATLAYDMGQSLISDKEWDDLYFKLKQLEEETGIIYPDSPTQTIKYDVVNELKKVEHNHQMLSLDKTKSIEDINTFIGNNDYVAMAKMDGLTCSLRYVKGKLVSAETRGNGQVGEDITHNARVISSIPKTIPTQEETVVDGEIVCLINDFENFSENYKNPRNFAAGSIRLLDAKECSNRKLTFIAWELISNNYPSFLDKLEALQSFGFEVVPWMQENPVYAISDIQDWCKSHYYPIDGIVFKYNDIAYGQSLGFTGHHCKDAIAFKFYDEEYETTLLNIEFGMSRTGQLTPVAIFNPIEMDDSTVTRASLHNLTIMKELLGNKPFIGEKIWVIKSNMIIPQITRAEINDNPTGQVIAVPAKCPVCGLPTISAFSDTNVETLVCSNPQCEGKLVNQLDHFFGKKGLDIKGISLATLEKLINWSWVNNIEDMFNLSQHKEEWITKPGFGKVSVNKILDALEAGKNCSLDKFICAIGIPLVGTTMSKQLAANFKTWEAFRQAIDNKFDFTQLTDIGYTIEQIILSFDYRQADKLASIIHITYAEPQSSNSNTLLNKKICITGKVELFKNRAELQAVIEKAGGKVLSSVSKNTDILINNDINSNSSKNVTAKKLAIPILTERQFLEEYGLAE